MDEISTFVNDIVDAPVPETPVEAAVEAPVEATVEMNAPAAANTPKVPPIMGVLGMYALGALVSMAVYGVVSLTAKGVQIGIEKIKDKLEEKRNKEIIEEEVCMDEEEEN